MNTTSRRWLTLLNELYQPPLPEEQRRQNEEFGRLLVELGLATREQVDGCLAESAEKERPFPLSRMLIDRGVMTGSQLAGSVIARAAEDPENRVGRYVLVSNLRGESWKAWDTTTRAWAQVTFVSEEERDGLRARTEAQVPGVARILELGTAGGRPFVAAEYVEGLALATVPRDDRRRLIDAVRAAADVVGGLHDRKLVHGALSSETIVLDSAGAVRLVGWGSGSDDLRALGKILFETVTDRPAPDRGVPEVWPRRLDDDLRAVLARALGPGYPSASEFSADLSRWLEGKPVRARSFLSRWLKGS